MRGVIKSLGLLFVQALAVGLAEQRQRGIYGQYSSVPERVTRNAIKRARYSGRGWKQQGEREMARRVRQRAAGQLRFHSEVIR